MKIIQTSTDFAIYLDTQHKITIFSYTSLRQYDRNIKFKIKAIDCLKLRL